MYNDKDRHGSGGVATTMIMAPMMVMAESMVAGQWWCQYCDVVVGVAMLVGEVVVEVVAIVVAAKAAT